jgi:esterase/lipase
MSDNDTMQATAQFHAGPLRALVDEPVAIRLSGLQAGQQVMLRARSRDYREKDWTSAALFAADSNGEINVAAQQPIAGSYHTADTAGLFWSMRPVGRTRTPLFVTAEQKPVMIDISAESEGATIGGTRLERRFAADGVVSQTVQEQGLVGVFCHPGGSGPYAAVIVLHGSDGNICENQAALLASHGYAALALRYFGADGLPERLVHIPLEYFETASHLLQAQSVVNGDRIGVIGLSRGGELALLLGATFPAIKAVVACSPCGLVQSGIDRNNYSHSAWTYRGKPLQQVVVRWNLLVYFKTMWQFARQRAFPLRNMFLTTLNDRKRLAEATIPVENTRGPILLISGDDDQLWPSTLFSQLIMQRLAEQRHPYADQHLHYAGAGHFVSFPYGYPYLPPFVKRAQGLAVGGTVEATAHSIADSWPKILAFFGSNL